ncbi:MAG: T9SS type A sorting domain-containing protein [Bacteroidetes bacterium]|nr:T9SS type A sorting domain-containing protein [Bacteroidota bacterium]
MLIIPTVIHIIHDNGNGDITDEQVLDGLRVINEDFRRLNSDTSVTRDTFLNFAGDCMMEFHLAKLDSTGDSTSGIVRINSPLMPHPEPTDTSFDNVKFITYWPSDMYYNIWLVRGIIGGSLGYAQYPGTNFTYGGPWRTWGPIIRSDVFGTIGTSSSDGRTATHEIGHTFGLYHTFLSATAGCGTACDTTLDQVCDTPPVTASSGCPTTRNSCSNDTLGLGAFAVDMPDQIENYMSYNSCQNMFSQGQADRMRGYIDEFPTINGLYSDSNLIATGLMEPFTGVEQFKTTTLNIVPNPSTGRFYIEFSSHSAIPVKVSILSIVGQLIAEVNTSSGSGIIWYDMVAPKGVYIVSVEQQGSVTSAKLIIQ